MNKLRRRSVIKLERLLSGRQNEQQPAVVVVCGEEIGARFRWKVALGIDLDLLIEGTDAPLQDSAYGVGLGGEAEPKNIPNGPTDNAFIVKAGQLKGAATACDHTGVVVADEERRVRSREVVIEEFKEKTETTFAAAFCATAKTVAGVDRQGAVAALRADEVMRHWSDQG